MYLSKILLDIRHPSVRQALRDANDMHRNLMAGFDMRSDTDAARAENHVLFRLYSRRDQMYLLVASDVKPDIPSLSARGFHTDEALIKDVTPLKQAFIPGRCFRFELLASPCKKWSATVKTAGAISWILPKRARNGCGERESRAALRSCRWMRSETARISAAIAVARRSRTPAWSLPGCCASAIRKPSGKAIPPVLARARRMAWVC